MQRAANSLTATADPVYPTVEDRTIYSHQRNHFMALKTKLTWRFDKYATLPMLLVTESVFTQNPLETFYGDTRLNQAVDLSYATKATNCQIGV